MGLLLADGEGERPDAHPLPWNHWDRETGRRAVNRNLRARLAEKFSVAHKKSDRLFQVIASYVRGTAGADYNFAGH